MKFKCTVISIGGNQATFAYADAPPLSMLREWVGGHIEAVPNFNYFGTDPCVVYCNEEGKLKGLTINTRATLLWAACIAPFRLEDILHGDVVIITAENPAHLQEL